MHKHTLFFKAIRLKHNNPNLCTCQIHGSSKKVFFVISKERDQKDVLNLFISDEGVVGEHFGCYFLGHNLFYLSNVPVIRIFIQNTESPSNSPINSF